jgi:hypothetical protein
MDSRRGFMLKVLAYFKHELEQKVISDFFPTERLQESVHAWPEPGSAKQPIVFLQVLLQPDKPLIAISYERTSDEIAEFEIIELERKESQDKVRDFNNAIISSLMPQDPLVCRAFLDSKDIEILIGEKPCPGLAKLTRRKYKSPSDKAAEIVVYTIPDMVRVLKEYSTQKVKKEASSGLAIPSQNIDKEVKDLLASIIDPVQKGKPITKKEFKDTQLQSSLMSFMPPELRVSELALRSKLGVSQSIWKVVSEIDKHFIQDGQDTVEELQAAISAFETSWEQEFNQPISFSSFTETPSPTSGFTIESSLDMNKPLTF